MSVRLQFLSVVLLAGAVLVAAPATLFAQGEHARRAGAELQVVLGDLRLLTEGEFEPQRVRGLQHRIQGILASLPVLLRMADQERHAEPVPVDAAALRALFHDGDYASLGERLDMLAESYPFYTHHLLGLTPSNRRLQRAFATHRQLCAACHDHPYLDTERPALHLYRQAKRQPPAEFAARMVIGVRGDVVTGLGNPFSDEELGALIALYRRAADSADAERLR